MGRAQGVQGRTRCVHRAYNGCARSVHRPCMPHAWDMYMGRAHVCIKPARGMHRACMQRAPGVHRACTGHNRPCTRLAQGVHGAFRGRKRHK